MATGFGSRFKGKLAAVSPLFLDGLALLFTNAGAPTNGTNGTKAGLADKGALLIDTTNGVFYQNTNTKASPTWTVFESSGGVGAFTNLSLTGLFNESAATGITAGTTRTQAGATALTKEVNRVDTSTAPTAGTTLGDGVSLPASSAGLTIMVINNTANPIQVYGGGTDTINGVATATGVPQMQNSLCIYTCAAAGTWQCEGTSSGFSGAFQTMLACDGMTAHAGGGQGSATPIVAAVSRFTTVANGTFGTNDSAKLPASAPGIELTVINAAALNTMDVFPASGDTINGQAANTALPVPAGTVVTFYCTVAGTWHSIVTPNGANISARTIHSGGRPPASSTDFTSATPAATETYLCEINVPSACVVNGIAVINGTAVSGHVQGFLLDANGQQIAATASTVPSGTSAYQRVPLSAAKYIGPGTYYIGLQVDNNTHRYGAHVFGDFGAGKLTGTTYGTFPSGQAMPTTFTTNLGPVASLY